MSENIDLAIRAIIFILLLAGAVVATIMFMRLESVDLLARVLLSICAWLMALLWIEIMREVV